jgi:spore germination protein GerM
MPIAVAACGLPTDDAPRQVAADNVPFELLGPSTTQPASNAGTGSQVTLYFVDGTTLRGVRRSVDNVNPQAVLAQLVKGRADTDQPSTANIRTAIPPNTTVVGSSLECDVLTVVLSPEILSETGAEQKTAFGQLVYTATEFSGIGSVRFKVVDQSGAEQDVAPPTDLGSKAEPVTRVDYSLLAP